MSRKGKSKFSTGSKYNTKIGQLFLGRSQNKLNKEDIVTGMRIQRTLENEYDKASKALDNLESIRPGNDNKIMDKDLLESMVKTSDIDVSIKYDALAIKEDNEGDIDMEDLYKKYNIQCDNYPYGKEVTDFMLEYFDKNDPTKIELINATIEKFDLNKNGKKENAISNYIYKKLKLPFTHQARRGRKPGTEIIETQTTKTNKKQKITEKKFLLDTMLNESILCGDIKFTNGKEKNNDKNKTRKYQPKVINKQMGTFLIINFKEFNYQPQENLYCKYVQYMLKERQKSGVDLNASAMQIFDEQTFREYIIGTNFYKIEPIKDYCNMYTRLEQPMYYNIESGKNDSKALISKAVKKYIYKFNDTKYNVDDMLSDIETNLKTEDTKKLFAVDKVHQREKLKYELFGRGILFDYDYEANKNTKMENQIAIGEVPQKLKEKIRIQKQSTFVAPVLTSANNFVTTQLKDVTKISFDDLLEKYMQFCSLTNDDVFIHDLHTEMIRLGHYNTVCEDDKVYYIKEIGTQKEKLKQEMYNNVLAFIKTCDTPVLTANEILGICEEQFPIYKLNLKYIIKMLDENFIGYTQLLHTKVATEPIIPNNDIKLEVKSTEEPKEFETGIYTTPYNNIPLHMTAQKLSEEVKQKDIVLPVKETTLKEAERIYKSLNVQLDEYPCIEEMLHAIQLLKKYKEIGITTNEMILKQINIDNRLQEDLKHDRENTFVSTEQSISDGYLSNMRRAKIYIGDALTTINWFLRSITAKQLEVVEQLLLNVVEVLKNPKYIRATDFIYGGQSEYSILDPEEDRSKEHEKFINRVNPYTNYLGTLQIDGTNLIIKTKNIDITYNRYGIASSNNTQKVTIQKTTTEYQDAPKQEVENDNIQHINDIPQKPPEKPGTSLWEVVYRKSGGGYGSFNRCVSYYRANSENQALEMFEKYRKTLKDVLISDIKCYRLHD